jgi:hypothetical protein
VSWPAIPPPDTSGSLQPEPPTSERSQSGALPVRGGDQSGDGLERGTAAALTAASCRGPALSAVSMPRAADMAAELATAPHAMLRSHSETNTALAPSGHAHLSTHWAKYIHDGENCGQAANACPHPVPLGRRGEDLTRSASLPPAISQGKRARDASGPGCPPAVPSSSPMPPWNDAQCTGPPPLVPSLNRQGQPAVHVNGLAPGAVPLQRAPAMPPASRSWLQRLSASAQTLRLHTQRVLQAHASIAHGSVLSDVSHYASLSGDTPYSVASSGNPWRDAAATGSDPSAVVYMSDSTSLSQAASALGASAGHRGVPPGLARAGSSGVSLAGSAYSKYTDPELSDSMLLQSQLHRQRSLAQEARARQHAAVAAQLQTSART